MQDDLLYLAVFIALAALILVPSIWALRPRNGKGRSLGPAFGRGTDRLQT